MSNRNFDARSVIERLNNKVIAQNTYSNQHYGQRVINNPQASNNSASVVSSYRAGAQTTYSETLQHGFIVNLGGIANFFILPTIVPPEPPTPPPTVPDPPTNVAAVGGVGTATVTFTPPVNNGGSSITGYNILYIDATGYTGFKYVTNSPAIITGLLAGPTSFTVSAINSVGQSLSSPPVSATVT
jgi:hypothetical protein